MLRKSQRVTTQLFEECMKKGRVIHSPLFVVRILHDPTLSPTPATSPARIAAVAPVKIAKTSVARHRIRRRIYEAVRPHVLQIAPGNIILFLAKQPVITATLSELRQAVSDIFVKAGLLR